MPEPQHKFTFTTTYIFSAIFTFSMLYAKIYNMLGMLGKLMYKQIYLKCLPC